MDHRMVNGSLNIKFVSAPFDATPNDIADAKIPP
jgi:hypothetical protein